MADASKTRLTGSKIILILAVVIAIIAVGAALWKKQGKSDAPQVATTQSDLPTAIAKLESKLKANPNVAEDWRMLGLAFFEQRKYAESATAYARATQIDPNRAEYWSSLGETLVLAGPGDVTPNALQAFQTAVERDPKDPRARYFLGVHKDMKGDHRGAIEDWIALLEDTPANAPWEADVRTLIAEVAAKQKIDIAGRIDAPKSPMISPATRAIPGPSAAEMRDASQLPKGQQDAMIQGMVDGLEAKLKAKPDNLNGWIMLMRSRIQLGETAKARIAFGAAKAALANDANAQSQLDTAAKELSIR